MSDQLRTIFVFVKCELGRAYQVAASLADEAAGCSEVYSVSGQYDLLVKCFLEPDQDIGHFVTEGIQRIPGVKDTFTVITFRAFG